MISTYLLFILFHISLIGYIAFIRKKLQISAYVAPLVAISLLTLLSYVFALCNLLKYSSYVIFALGLILFVFWIRSLTRAQIFHESVINGNNVLLVLAYIFISYTVLHLRLIHYDNFSHWALAVKHLLLTDALPSANSVLIEFKNYPPASTLWIYQVCKIIGPGEGVMLTAQSMTIYAAFLCMFTVVRDTKRFLLQAIIWLSFGIMTIFNISIRLDNLLVDFLLPLLAIAVIAILVKSKDLKQDFVSISIILANMLLVKNNAIFFAVLCLLYLLFKVFTQKTQWRYALYVLLISTIFFGSWQMHTKQEFKNTEHKFDVNNQDSKTAEDVNLILKEYKTQVLTPSNRYSLGFVVINIGLLFTFIIGKVITKKKWQLFRTLLICDTMYVLYYLAILIMYIYMMPMEEASYLAGFERYTSSIIIFFIGALTLVLVRDVENSFAIQQGPHRSIYSFKSLRTKDIYMQTCMLFAGIAALLILSEMNGMTYLNKHYDETIVGKANRLLEDFQPETPDSHYLIYASDTNNQVSNNYLGYVSRYFLMTNQIYCFSNKNDPEFTTKQDYYDYLIMIEPAILNGKFYKEGIYKLHE